MWSEHVILWINIDRLVVGILLMCVIPVEAQINPRVSTQ